VRAELFLDGDADAVARLAAGEPAAGGLRAGVRGTDHALARGEIGGDSTAPIRVIAERDHVRSGREQLVGELSRDPRSVGCVLAVDDREIGVVPLAQRRQVLLDGTTPRDAEDVREEEDLQGRAPS
jgi:hypothetical protein